MSIKETELALDGSLARIKKFGDEKRRPFSEAALEAILLIDLFRDELGYDEKTASHQEHQAGKSGKEIPDITLKLVASEGGASEIVFVEIKRYNKFKAEHERIKAIEQAACYAITQKARYGIVTDGVRWTYFVVPNPPRLLEKKFARRVAEFDLSGNAANIRLGKMLLRRSNRSELLKLFEVLTRLHGSVTWKELETTYQLKYIEDRVGRAWNQEGGGAVPASEKELLHLMYRKDNFHTRNFCYKIQPRE